MTTQLAKTTEESTVLSKIMLDNDLSSLTPGERLTYVQQLSQHMGLNPFTQPLQFIQFQTGMLSLYATKNCADQLRDIRKVSIDKVEAEEINGYCKVTVYGSIRDPNHPDGLRKDSDFGVVPLTRNGKPLEGEAYANALMKAVTKAKRRFTLSICQLGFMDETEMVTVDDANPVVMNYETGDIDFSKLPPPKETYSKPDDDEYKFYCKTHDKKYRHAPGQKEKGYGPSHKDEETGNWCSEGSEGWNNNDNVDSVPEKILDSYDWIPDPLSNDKFGELLTDNKLTPEDVKKALGITAKDWISTNDSNARNCLIAIFENLDSKEVSKDVPW